MRMRREAGWRGSMRGGGDIGRGGGGSIRESRGEKEYAEGGGWVGGVLKAGEGVDRALQASSKGHSPCRHMPAPPPCPHTPL